MLRIDVNDHDGTNQHKKIKFRDYFVSLHTHVAYVSETKYTYVSSERLYSVSYAASRIRVTRLMPKHNVVQSLNHISISKQL